MTPRVVFFGSSESVFSNRHFRPLCEAPCELLGVVDVLAGRRTSTNTNSPSQNTSFAAFARQRRIPVFEPAQTDQPEFVAALLELHPDLFVAAGYMNLLKAAVLAAPRLMAANFHASLLPAYRGKHPLFWALRNGERWVGLTVHVMDAGLDTGSILYQVRVRTRRDDSVAVLYERIMLRSVGLVGRLIADAGAGKLRPRPQGSEGTSYYSSVTAEDFRLDWARDASALSRWVYASPGQCFSEMSGHRVYFKDARSVRLAGDAAIGQVVSIGRTTCVVAAGQGGLCLGQARLAEGDWCSLPSLCHDLGIDVGNCLGR